MQTGEVALPVWEVETFYRRKSEFSASRVTRAALRVYTHLTQRHETNPQVFKDQTAEILKSISLFLKIMHIL